MPVKAKNIKDLPLKEVLDGSESLLVQDSNGTKQAPLGTIVDEIKQNSQEKIREIESELTQTNAQLEHKMNYYNSISQMKNANLKVGDCVNTSGYYHANDGGGANYIIVQNGVVDNGYIHKLNNGLYAQMLINDKKCNIKQFGAKGDGVTDDTQAILNANNCKAIHEVLFTVGDYKFTKPLVLSSYKKFKGTSYMDLWDNYKETTTRLLYYPQTNDTTAVTLEGAHVTFEDLVIVNMVWGKNTTGLTVRPIRSFINKIKIYDFEKIGLILGGMYCQYNSIEVTCTNEFISWVNSDRANRLCYALCRCDDWHVVNEGYKATDATVQNLTLGSPTWGIHKYGLIIKGINHKFIDLFIPTPAQYPVVFGDEVTVDDQEGAFNCEINHVYMEENKYSGFDYNFIFRQNTRGCRVTNGYLSGMLKVLDDGLQNDYKVTTALNLLSNYDKFPNSKNYADFYFINEEGSVKITDGIATDGNIYNNLFYMLSVSGQGVKFISKNKISIDATKVCSVSARIKNSYEAIELTEGKTVCFGCKYKKSSDCDVDEKFIRPSEIHTNNRGIGMNGVASGYAKIPRGWFKDNNYFYFNFVHLTSENIGTKGTIELYDFFFYIVEENVSPYNKSVTDGGILNGKLLAKDNIILKSASNNLFKINVDDTGALSTTKCFLVKTTSGIGYKIEPLSPNIIEAGEKFYFKVLIYDGYSSSGMTVPDATDNGDGTYYRTITKDGVTIFASGVTKI